MKKNHGRLCAICGGVGATTDDHLPPQNLYPKPRPVNEQLFSVPACPACNNGASADDEEFKIVIGISRSYSEGDMSSLITSLRSTFANNNRLKKVVHAGVGTYLFDKGKLRTGPVQVTFDEERYRKVVSRIIRGLYWRETGTALGPETPIEVIDAASLTTDGKKAMRELLILPELERRTLNGGTVIYKYHIEGNGSSFWAVHFFSAHAVFAFAASPMCPRLLP